MRIEIEIKNKLDDNYNFFLKGETKKKNQFNKRKKTMIVNRQKESDHDNLKKQSFYKFFLCGSILNQLNMQ